jgi:hypothetical protein
VASDIEIERALASITATLNDRQVEQLERERLQRLVDSAVGEALVLSVDDGGGLHDDGGARVGAIRRTPSGEWIAERQNDAAQRSHAAVPGAGNSASPLRRLLNKLKP